MPAGIRILGAKSKKKRSSKDHKRKVITVNLPVKYVTKKRLSALVSARRVIEKRVQGKTRYFTPSYELRVGSRPKRAEKSLPTNGGLVNAPMIKPRNPLAPGTPIRPPRT